MTNPTESDLRKEIIDWWNSFPGPDYPTGAEVADSLLAPDGVIDRLLIKERRRVAQTIINVYSRKRYLPFRKRTR